MITGTAATGAALANRPVEARCAAGTGSATTGADGAYQLSIAAGALPCVVRVTTVGGAVFHSLALGSGSGASAIANLTPATQFLVAVLGAVDPAAYYAAFAGDAAALLSAASVRAAETRVVDYLRLAGVDFSAAGGLLVGAIAPASPYDATLDALGAAEAQASITPAALTATFVQLGTGSAVVPPPELAFRPAAAGCAALRSGTYRIVMPRSGATMAEQSGRATIDAAALTIVRPDGSTGTLAASGPCHFIDSGRGYSADIAVSPAGVLSARYSADAGASQRYYVGVPEQTHALAELATTWNLMGMKKVASGYVGAAGSTTLDGAGKVTAATSCQNNATWAVDVCSTASASVVALATPLTVDAGGGFAEIDATSGAVTSRSFAYRSGSGDLMLVSIDSDGSFFFGTPLQAVALPTVGVTTSSLLFDLPPLLAPVSPVYENTSTITSVDAATSSYGRIKSTGGVADSHAETLFANSPRNGLVHRLAGTVTLADGSTLHVNEFTSMSMPGMGISPLVLILLNGKLFEVSVREP